LRFYNSDCWGGLIISAFVAAWNLWPHPRIFVQNLRPALKNIFNPPKFLPLTSTFSHFLLPLKFLTPTFFQNFDPLDFLPPPYKFSENLTNIILTQANNFDPLQRWPPTIFILNLLQIFDFNCIPVLFNPRYKNNFDSTAFIL